MAFAITRRLTARGNHDDSANRAWHARQRRLPDSCKARSRIADALRLEWWRMTGCSHFIDDPREPRASVAALTRFGTVRLSVMSAFDTVWVIHGYRCGRRPVR